ncbi:MAG: hypothetical protein IPK75_18705 [Acidobacteria bacterium]|nr:hypothetical protein [Acidobacteriota bacterium]
MYVAPVGGMTGVEARRPVLMVGGDHPYQQYWGTDGTDGLAAMCLDRGIPFYIAINTDDVNAPGQPDMMTWAQCAALQSRGVEFVNHGAWHLDKWNRANTGIRIEYIGTNASATVQITTTQVVATSAAPSSDSVTVTLSTDDTLAKVKTALELNGKWRVTLDVILTGSEASTNLFAMNAARNILADTDNEYFCAGGGIEIRQTTRTYQHAWVRRTSGGSFTIFADGVTKYNLSLGTNSIDTLVAAVEALTDFDCRKCDNGRTEAASKPSYLIGDELATNLRTLTYLDLTTRPAVLDAGLPNWYIIDRQMQKAVETAAANGITLRHFAQSGSNFHSWHTNHKHAGLYRGNPLYRETTPPIMARADVKNFVTHRALTNTGSAPTYEGANVLALIRALCGDQQAHTQEPWLFCALMHKLQDNGTTGYVLTTTNPAYYDQIDSDWLAALDLIREKVAANLLRVMTCDQVYSLDRSPRPNNLFFNPGLENAGDSFKPATGAQDGGFWVPGWLIVRASTMSTLAISDGVLSCVNSSSTATELMSQEIELEPGKTYEFTAQLNVSAWTTGNGIQWSFQSMRGRVQGLTVPGTNFKITGAQINQSGEVTMRVTVPKPPNFVPPQVISDVAQTWNLSTNHSIQINILSQGAIDNLNCSTGAASASAVTAKEVAAAINAAIAANATYAALPEYHTVARAEAGRVVLTAPYVGTDQGSALSVSAASSNSATATIFGNATCEGRAQLMAPGTADRFVARLALRSSMQASFTITRPTCRAAEFG